MNFSPCNQQSLHRRTMVVIKKVCRARRTGSIYVGIADPFLWEPLWGYPKDNDRRSSHTLPSLSTISVILGSFLAGLHSISNRQNYELSLESCCISDSGYSTRET